MENFTQGILNAYLDHFLFNFFGLWISYRGLKKKVQKFKKMYGNKDVNYKKLLNLHPLKQYTYNINYGKRKF